MRNDRPPGCDYCSDPLTVTLRERELRRLNEQVAIFECPRCRTLILDDILGWKGSGVVFHATEAMIAEYMASIERGYGR